MESSVDLIMEFVENSESDEICNKIIQLEGIIEKYTELLKLEFEYNANIKNIFAQNVFEKSFSSIRPMKQKITCETEDNLK